jgi:hypothetical protein
LRRLKEIEIARGQVETIERLLLERFVWTTREKTGKIKEIRVYRNRTPQTRQKPPELKRFPMENEPVDHAARQFDRDLQFLVESGAPQGSTFGPLLLALE